MEAIFVNPQQTPQPTPSQVIATFVTDYPIGRVREMLFEVFRLAVLGGLGSEKSPLSIDDVASLFDQLIDLAGALASENRGSGATLYLNREEQRD